LNRCQSGTTCCQFPDGKRLQVIRLQENYPLTRRNRTSIRARKALPRCDTRCLAAGGTSAKLAWRSGEKNSGS